jgi:hypothetical protein
MPSDKWLKQTNNKLKAQGYPTARRPIEALSIYSKEYRSPHEINSATAAMIVNWFRKH